jgi:hypothetical protein
MTDGQAETTTMLPFKSRENYQAVKTLSYKVTNSITGRRQHVQSNHIVWHHTECWQYTESRPVWPESGLSVWCDRSDVFPLTRCQLDRRQSESSHVYSGQQMNAAVGQSFCLLDQMKAAYHRSMYDDLLSDISLGDATCTSHRKALAMDFHRTHMQTNQLIGYTTSYTSRLRLVPTSLPMVCGPTFTKIICRICHSSLLSIHAFVRSADWLRTLDSG